MNYEMNVFAGDKLRKVFVQSGFFRPDSFSKAIHKHRYGEIHVISRGSGELSVDGKIINLTEGDAVYIPAESFHCLSASSEDTRRIAFQCDIDLPSLTKKRINSGILRAFEEKVREYDGDDGTAIASYIALVLSHFEGVRKFSPIVDREFLIWEFFSNNYDKDICVEDLAAELNLSKKQTCRVVEKLTGNTFSKEITKKRMEAAKRLSETTELCLTEIAARVGYKSYSGFYKAYKANK